MSFCRCFYGDEERGWDRWRRCHGDRRGCERGHVCVPCSTRVCAVRVASWSFLYFSGRSLSMACGDEMEAGDWLASERTVGEGHTIIFMTKTNTFKRRCHWWQWDIYRDLSTSGKIRCSAWGTSTHISLLHTERPLITETWHPECFTQALPTKPAWSSWKTARKYLKVSWSTNRSFGPCGLDLSDRLLGSLEAFKLNSHGADLLMVSTFKKTCKTDSTRQSDLLTVHNEDRICKIKTAAATPACLSSWIWRLYVD